METHLGRRLQEQHCFLPTRSGWQENWRPFVGGGQWNILCGSFEGIQCRRERCRDRSGWGPPNSPTDSASRSRESSTPVWLSPSFILQRLVAFSVKGSWRDMETNNQALHTLILRKYLLYLILNLFTKKKYMYICVCTYISTHTQIKQMLQNINNYWI